VTDARLVHVIDDEEEVCQSTAFLMRSAGLECHCWPSGISFLEGADLMSRGCVILDVRMPGQDGYAVQEELDRRGSRLQVIMVSGHADGAESFKATEAGAVGFLDKPYDGESLLKMVERALSL
jgi:two-component system response regulator FixJ